MDKWKLPEFSLQYLMHYWRMWNLKKVIPADYRLFQVADLICTLKLTELKANRHLLSKSEIYFFENERTLKKNYLKPFGKKEM